MTDILDTRTGYGHFERVAVPVWATGHGSAAFLACADSALAAQLRLDDGRLYASCVEARCRMHREVAPGNPLDTGLRVIELGTASVRFELGLFHPGEEKPAASACLALVLVDRVSGKPAPIPADLRSRLEAMKA